MGIKKQITKKTWGGNRKNSGRKKKLPSKQVGFMIRLEYIEELKPIIKNIIKNFKPKQK